MDCTDQIHLSPEDRRLLRALGIAPSACPGCEPAEYLREQILDRERKGSRDDEEAAPGGARAGPTGVP